MGKSGPNWLDRLRSSKGLPVGNGDDLEKFLNTNPNSVDLDPRSKSSSAVLDRRSSRAESQSGMEKESLFDSMTSVLEDLFIMGGDSRKFSEIQGFDDDEKKKRKKKSCRKQSNPKICVLPSSARPSEPSEGVPITTRRPSEPSEGVLMTTRPSEGSEGVPMAMRPSEGSEGVVPMTRRPSEGSEGFDDDEKKKKKKKNCRKQSNPKICVFASALRLSEPSEGVPMTNRPSEGSEGVLMTTRPSEPSEGVPMTTSADDEIKKKKKKSSRKQSNPKICVFASALRPLEPSEGILMTARPSEPSEGGLMTTRPSEPSEGVLMTTSADNSVVEVSDDDKVVVVEEQGNVEEVDEVEEVEVDFSGYSKAEVMIIDTSATVWKSEKVIYRKGNVWRIRDKKSKCRKVFGRKRREVMGESDSEGGAEKKKKKKKKEKSSLSPRRSSVEGVRGKCMMLNEDRLMTTGTREEFRNLNVVPEKRHRFARSARKPARPGSSIFNVQDISTTRTIV